MIFSGKYWKHVFVFFIGGILLLGIIYFAQPVLKMINKQINFNGGAKNKVIPKRLNGFYKVDRVIDGDTVVVKNLMEKGGSSTIAGMYESYKLRLIGINTPETVDPRKTVQCFGLEASKKAHDLLDGATIRIESDISQDVVDKYGRYLEYVYLENPANSILSRSSSSLSVAVATSSSEFFFNRYMIEQGYAYEYTYSVPYLYQKDFKKEEKLARKRKIGLWSDAACANGQLLK